jgi:adenosine deaminase
MRKKLSFVDICSFPKPELHRHADGSVEDGVLMRLADRYGVKLPTCNPGEFKKIYSVAGVGFPELFQRFGWAIAVMRTPEGLEEVFYEQVLDLAAENILYAELRFAPSYHSYNPPAWYKPADYEMQPFKPMFMRETVIRALAGIKRGMAETGIVVNLILCIPRELHDEKGKPGMALATQIAEIAMKFQEDGVVAIDLACDEAAHPPDVYADIFQLTRGSKIRRDPHSGEMGRDVDRTRNIRTCIDKFDADGLGHAYALADHPIILEEVRDKGTRVERNPFGRFSADGALALGNDGLDVLLDEGVLVSICSDDPVLMGKSLSDNFKAVLDHYSWGEKEFQQLVANGVKSGFYTNLAQAKKVREMFVRRGLEPRFLK